MQLLIFPSFSLLSSTFLPTCRSNSFVLHSLLSTFDFSLSFILSPLSVSSSCQSRASPTGVQTDGATVPRASPRMTRCCLSRASKATPARPPKNLSPLLQRLPPQNPPKKWIFSASTGRTSAVPRLSPRLLLLQPPPRISWGTCSGGRHSQPVCRHLPSPHRTKWPQTLPHHAPRLLQVQNIFHVT